MNIVTLPLENNEKRNINGHCMNEFLPSIEEFTLWLMFVWW